ncbi:hypothetical protein, partial [Alistipes shahii]|uniref:hypothetical protein n=1 Tax=Alistipes shahii TaxID=328814 RepID=UPI0034A366B6
DRPAVFPGRTGGRPGERNVLREPDLFKIFYYMPLPGFRGGCENSDQSTFFCNRQIINILNIK